MLNEKRNLTVSGYLLSLGKWLPLYSLMLFLVHFRWNTTRWANKWRCICWCWWCSVPSQANTCKLYNCFGIVFLSTYILLILLYCLPF